MRYAGGSRERLRKINQKRFYAVLIMLISVLFIKSALGPGAANESLEIVAKISLPIKEVSGIALISGNGLERVYAVGDREATLAQVDLKDSKFLDASSVNFESILLQKYSPCMRYNTPSCRAIKSILTSDWEAIAVDGRKNIFLLQEDTSAVVVFDENLRNPYYINLDFSKYAKTNNTALGNETKLAEGLILLKNGHFAVVKESAPAIVIEFAPQGNTSLGIHKDSLLNAEKEFALPDRSIKERMTFVPVAEWEISSGDKCDLSEITFQEASGDLYVLSQKCSTIFQFSSLPETAPKLSIISKWNLPRKIKNPEGLAVRNDGSFLIGSDRKSTTKPNLFLLKRI